MKCLRSLSRFPLFAAACFALLCAPGYSEPAKEPAPKPILVKKVTNVEYAIQESEPPSLVVTATGQVPTGGYTNVTLDRVVYVTPPADGMQEYRLHAVPPSGPAIQVVSSVTAKELWKDYKTQAPWIRGVRILGEGEGIMEKKFDAQ